jgi:hypothetical protein
LSFFELAATALSNPNAFQEDRAKEMADQVRGEIVTCFGMV